MDRNTANIVLKQIKESIQAVLDKNNLTWVKAPRGTFTDTDLRVRLEVASKQDANKILTQKAEAKTEVGDAILQLLTIDKGFEFSYVGKKYKVVGGKNGKMGRVWVIAERIPDGRKFKFPPVAVKPGVLSESYSYAHNMERNQETPWEQ